MSEFNQLPNPNQQNSQLIGQKLAQIQTQPTPQTPVKPKTIDIKTRPLQTRLLEVITEYQERCDQVKVIATAFR